MIGHLIKHTGGKTPSGNQVFCGASAVLLVSLLLLAAGCGGSNTPGNITNPGSANTTINTGDATNDQVLAFELTINTLTLSGKDSSGNSVNPSVLSKPTEVEFVHQAGTFEPLTLANLPAGTYTSASLSVSNPEVVAVISGAPTKLTATLSSSTVTVTFPSPITITSSSSAVINFDLDLASSISITGTSATVTPTFKVTTATVNANNENNEDNDNGEIEDVHGSVSAVAASANPPTFTITTHSGSSLTFTVNSNTRFDGDRLSGLAQLMVGAVVEVDGVTQADGSKLATKVEAEENEGANGEEAEGVITNVGGTAPADVLTVAAQVEMMTGNSSSVVGHTFTVNTNANTKFVVRADKLNLSSTPAFDASDVGKGQRIEADTANGDMSNGASISADTIKLREQALIGTVAATPAPTSSGFTLTLSSTSAFGNLTGATSIPVSIVSGTELHSGTTITPGATVRVRGLIFFNAGAYSMIAARIDSND
jgi:hypothetical protein